MWTKSQTRIVLDRGIIERMLSENEVLDTRSNPNVSECVQRLEKKKTEVCLKSLKRAELLKV